MDVSQQNTCAVHSHYTGSFSEGSFYNRGAVLSLWPHWEQFNIMIGKASKCIEIILDMMQ